MAASDSFYVAVYCSGITRYAPISEFIASLAKLPATFSSITVTGGKLVGGPSHAAFNTLLGTICCCNAGSGYSDIAVADLEARVTVIEKTYRPKPQEFDDEFSPDSD